MNKNLVTGIIMDIFALFVIIITATTIQNPHLENDVGPQLFPFIAGAGLLICGTGIMFKKPSASKPYLSREGWRRLIIMSIVSILYAVGLSVLGFLIATPIVVYVTIRLLGMNPKAYIRGGIVSIGLTLAIYYVFEKVLTVMLPAGMFF